jgi:hypothetical protein
MTSSVSTNKCAGIVGDSYYIFELNYRIDSKSQFLDFVAIVFSERYVIMVRTNSITTKDLYLTFQGKGKCIYVTYCTCINLTDADLNIN